jgi:DNA-nicking Smr family endonuclease
MVRRLAPEEKALWQKVIATVRPLDPASTEAQPNLPEEPALSTASPGTRIKPRAPTPSPPKANAKPGTTLDSTWDRRLARGLVQPDLIVDLHGHNLDSAYGFLDSRLDEAVTSGARTLLLITGKPPEGDRRPTKRGAIRAAVGDWLAPSRHARHIAAVRGAHPRHGGAGALYIILRRQR